MNFETLAETLFETHHDALEEIYGERDFESTDEEGFYTPEEVEL